jgi:hypothetical protein
VFLSLIPSLNQLTMAQKIGAGWKDYNNEDPFEAGGLEFDPRQDMEEQAAVRRHVRGIGDKGDSEICQNYTIRVNNEGYSLNSRSKPYPLDDEVKCQRRLVVEGVTLENSPINHLQSRYDFLDQIKFHEIEYEVLNGLISQQEYDLELQLMIVEMDTLERIIIERTNHSQQIGSSFPLVGTVFGVESNANKTYSEIIADFRYLFEIFYRRQIEIDLFNDFKELTSRINTKVNGGLN